MAVKSGIDIPSELRWDGYNSNGSVVPDGTYFFMSKLGMTMVI